MASLVSCKRGLCFIISAPAGTGKTTLVKMLSEEFANIVASVSYTTRASRVEEIEGIHYHFIPESDFQAKIEACDFLEYVNLYGYYYGTSRQWVEDRLNKGQHVVLVIDTQGAMQLKGNFPGVFVFIRPPSLEVLKERLIKRKTETDETLEKRLRWAQEELKVIPYYDYEIINDDLLMTYQVLRSIVIAECHRVKNLSSHLK